MGDLVLFVQIRVIRGSTIKRWFLRSGDESLRYSVGPDQEACFL